MKFCKRKNCDRVLEDDVFKVCYQHRRCWEKGCRSQVKRGRKYCGTHHYRGSRRKRHSQSMTSYISRADLNMKRAMRNDTDVDTTTVTIRKVDE